VFITIKDIFKIIKKEYRCKFITYVSILDT
jgi:hypothetical protein